MVLPEGWKEGKDSVFLIGLETANGKSRWIGRTHRRGRGSTFPSMPRNSCLVRPGRDTCCPGFRSKSGAGSSCVPGITLVEMSEAQSFLRRIGRDERVVRQQQARALAAGAMRDRYRRPAQSLRIIPLKNADNR